MTRAGKWSLGSLAVVLIALAVLGGIARYNWWIRHTWVRIYPACFNGDGLVEVIEPLTPEAERMFLAIMQDHGSDDPNTRVYGNVVYGNMAFRLLNDGNAMQVTGIMTARLAKARGLDKEDSSLCSSFGAEATASGSQRPRQRNYFPFWFRLIGLNAMERLAFGAHYLEEKTAVGRYFRRFDGDIGLPTSGHDPLDRAP